MAPPVEGQAWREGLSSVDQSWVEAGLEGMPTMTERDPLLVERQKTHGSFAVHAQTTWDFKDILHQMPNWNNLSTQHKEALHMIVHKIGRIASGNANFKDHWDDIAGYAKLGSEACE